MKFTKGGGGCFWAAQVQRRVSRWTSKPRKTNHEKTQRPPGLVARGWLKCLRAWGEEKWLGSNE